jgi:hypothetical protein
MGACSLLDGQICQQRRAAARHRCCFACRRPRRAAAPASLPITALTQQLLEQPSFSYDLRAAQARAGGSARPGGLTAAAKAAQAGARQSSGAPTAAVRRADSQRGRRAHLQQ